MSGLITAAGIAAAATVASTGMSMLSKSGSGGGTATQTQQQQLPEWIEQGGMQNWSEAKNAAMGLMAPYSGQRVADMTPQQQELIRQLYNRVGTGNEAYERAQGITNGLAGFNSGQLTPQYLRDTNLSPYMQPFTASVTNPTMQLMEQSRRQALGQIGDQATQARAFGGSRQGISEGVTNSQSELQKGKYIGELQSANFLNAQQMALGDIGRNWQGQTANMGARQFDAGFQRDTAGRIAGLADARQQNFLQGLTASMGGEQMLQKQQQDKYLADLAYYNEQKQYPLDKLAIQQNALSNSPYGKSSTSTAPGPTTDPWMTGLGVGSTTLGMIGSLGKMGLFGGSTPTSSPVPTSGYQYSPGYYNYAGSGSPV